jgi:hypothetical protein
VDGAGSAVAGSSAVDPNSFLPDLEPALALISCQVYHICPQAQGHPNLVENTHGDYLNLYVFKAVELFVGNKT